MCEIDGRTISAKYDVGLSTSDVTSSPHRHLEADMAEEDFKKFHAVKFKKRWQIDMKRQKNGIVEDRRLAFNLLYYLKSSLPQKNKISFALKKSKSLTDTFQEI